MTDAEIIKALECCKMPVGSGACNGCSLKDTRNKRLTDNEKSCTTILLENTLDLVNRQKAEIERLKLGVNVELDNFASEYDSKIKAEAIKEFAEKLKDDMVPNIDDTYIESFVEEYIDDLVKEMAGDAE